jgi:hypothetical protein
MIRIKIFKEKAGVISGDPIWVAFEGPYMYLHSTFLGLLKLLITEWRNDRHLVG